jgi:hypothetical protein
VDSKQQDSGILLNYEIYQNFINFPEKYQKAPLRVKPFPFSGNFPERIWGVVPSPPMKRHDAVELKEESYERQKPWKNSFRLGSGGWSGLGLGPV